MTTETNTCKLNTKTNRCSKHGDKKTLLCTLNTETNRCIKRKTQKIKLKKKPTKHKITIKKHSPMSKPPVISVKTKNTLITKKSNEKKNRKKLCTLPDGFEYVSMLGERGKEGEAWKVINTDKNTYHAVKIFDSKKSVKKMMNEIITQQKIQDYNISPTINWVSPTEKCFMMDLINGISLLEYLKHGKNIKYTSSIVKQLYNIVIALAEKQIGYNDDNVKMNIMYDKTHKKFILIDFGMIASETTMKQLAKKHSLSIHEAYLSKAFGIILKAEELFMKKIYGTTEFKYTPLGGVYKPNSSFPSLMKYVFEHGLQDKISYLNILKKTYQGKYKKYDESKQIGV